MPSFSQRDGVYDMPTGGNRFIGFGNNPAPRTPPNLVDYPNAPVPRAFQPSFPGSMEALAAQLQAGYGSGDMEAFLSSLYQPMTIMQLMEPISTTAKLYDKKKYNPINTGNEALDKLLMGATASGGGNVLFGFPRGDR